MDISRTHTTLHRLNTSTIRSLPSNEWLISQSQEVLRSTWPNNSSQFGSRTSLTNRSIDERPRYTGRYKYATVFQYFVQCTTQPAHPIQSSQHYSSPPTPNQPTNQTKPNQTKPNQTINMQFSTLAIAAFAALTSAAALKRAPIDLCPSLDTPQCCQLDVDGVADLTCSARKCIDS